MMDLKNILSELRRLESLVEGWRTREQISVIERDLALDKLKALYEAVRFADAVAEEPDENEPSTAPIAVASTAPIPLVEEALPIEEEPAVIDFEELMSVEEPVVTLPVSEPETESAQPDEEPKEPVEPSEHTEREQPTDQPELQQPADEAVEPVKEPAEERPAVLQNSLFDLDEIPVHRRGSRRVMLSLYGEAPVRTTKRKHKEEHKEHGTEEVQLQKEVESTDQPEKPCDESAPSLLAEAMREEISARSDVEELSETKEQPQVSQSMVSTDELTDEEADDELLFREETVVTEPLSRQQGDSVPVLGEVIHADQQTLADTFASGATLASQLAQGGESLRKMIALNDRFLLRAELFDDNQDLYEQAIEVLDNLPSLDDCMIYIAENYNWNANSEAAKLLFELLERRYGE